MIQTMYILWMYSVFFCELVFVQSEKSVDVKVEDIQIKVMWVEIYSNLWVEFYNVSEVNISRFEMTNWFDLAPHWGISVFCEYIDLIWCLIEWDVP